MKGRAEEVRRQVALCYLAPSMKSRPAETDYVDRIAGPAKEHRFPH